MISIVFNNVFKELLKYNIYKTYYEFIDQEYLKINYPEYYKIFLCYKELYKEEKDYNIEDLILVFNTKYPGSNKEVINKIFEEIKNSSASEDSVEELLNKIKVSNLSAIIALKYSELSTHPNNQKLIDEIEELSKQLQVKVETIDDRSKEFLTTSLEELLEERKTTPGIHWRLPSLNKNLGTLNPGDFGIVFARPETGKTTFLVSEITGMLEDPSNPTILWINNEERGKKVLIRIYQGLSGKSLPELYSSGISEDKKSLAQKYLLFKDVAAFNKKDLEQLVIKYKPNLLVVDQFDKIGGFTADVGHLEQKERYVWGRQIAKTYSMSVIAVCQASVSGENKKWLQMSDMDLSKTGKAAEADWILGIGKVDEEGKESLRYFHLCKNKLDSGDAVAAVLSSDQHKTEMEESKERHAKWTVRIRPDIGRYQDI